MNRVTMVCVPLVMFLDVISADATTMDDQAAYCTTSGGVVEEMFAEISTHDGLVKGNSRAFCNFTLENAFISIGLETFSDDTPSIAATFMKQMGVIGSASPLWKGKFANPSLSVCKNLGGATIGFVANGGFSNPLGQTDICVFGDGSMVSAWSLIYMANHREGYDRIKMNVKATPLSINIPS